MKKIKHLLIIALVLFSTTTFSQSFNGGLLGGMTVSQVDGDTYSGYHQIGCTFGAYVNLPMSDFFSMQMELKYSMFGSHSDVKEEELGHNHYNLRLHYAEVPLMIRYNLGGININGNSLNKINVEAGLSLDFLLDYSDNTNYSVNETAPWCFFSVTGNVGMHFDLTDHLGIGVRSMNSITPIRLRGESPSLLYGHYYNIALQAVVTYNIKASDRH